MRVRLSSLAISLFLAISTCVHADTRYVVPANSGAAYPYNSWSIAATSILDAVSAAIDGETVIVSNGQYRLTNEVVLDKGITLQGLGGATGVTVRGSFPARLTNRCFVVNHASAVLDGFTITNGLAFSDSSLSAGRGGGVYVANGTVQGCVVSFCRAADSGGGLFVAGGLVSNCVVAGNVAGTNGGGACLSAGALQASVVRQNVASNAGGGVFESGVIEVTGCTVSGNIARVMGGGVYAENGTVRGCEIRANVATNGGGAYAVAATVVASVFSGNLATNVGGGLYLSAGAQAAGCWLGTNTSLTFGGGVYVASGVVAACSVTQNFARAGGGGLFVLAGSVTGSAVSANSSTNGAGLFLSDVAAEVGDCDIAGNVALYGGGVYVATGRVWGARFIGNAATNAGGGAYLLGGFLTNCVLGANRSVGNGGGVYVQFSDAVLADARITGNVARLNGGGVFAATGAVVNCQVLGNLATNAGGGVYLAAAGATNCFVAGNISFGNGGGIYADRAESMVWGCTASANLARVAGGGVYCQTGQVWWTLSRANLATNAGGGIYVTNGLLWGCRAIGNNATNGGGLFVAGTSAVYNTLSAENSALQGGGGYCGTGTLVRSSTLSANTARDGGGLYCISNVTVENSIIYGNSGMLSVNWTNFGTGLVCQYSCTAPTNKLTGDGNLLADPLLLNPAGSDYRLGAGSPCMEAGSNQDWMVGADLAGATRIAGTRVDMGAYESGALVCSVVPSKQGGSLPDLAQFVFRAAVGGFDVANLVYYWDFNGDGVAEVSGANQVVVTNTYTLEGLWPVGLVVSNTMTAEWTSTALPVYIATYYVSPSGGHLYPYTNWTMAATSVQAAVDAAWGGSWVRVADGTYGQTNVLLISKALLVKSENGAAATVLRSSIPARTARVVQVTSAGAVLDGFTVTNGMAVGAGAAGQGGGVLLLAGRLNNSIVAGNVATNGAGIYIGAGVVSNCLVTGNRAALNGGGIYADRAESLVWGCSVTGNYARLAGGVFCQTGQVWWSEIRANVATNAAGGVWVTNGLVFGCKMVGNWSTNGGGFFVSGTGAVYNSLSADNAAVLAGGGGYCISSSAVRSCTIAGNWGRDGGGLYSANAVSIENSVIYGNNGSLSANWTNAGAGPTYQFCCATPVVTMPGFANTGADPLFLSPAGGNYRLAVGSPCTDAGSNQAWMATTTDVLGAPRLLGARVDIGAYEAYGFACGISASQSGGSLPDLNQIVFQARVSGTNLSNLVYYWDLTGDGIADVWGADQAVLTNTFAAEGLYSVSVVVSNTLTAEFSTAQTPVYIATYYVSPSGGHIYPYTNWTMAATSVQAAVDAAWGGSWVRVGDGTYGQTNTLLITKALLVKSENGAAATVLRSPLPAVTARVVQVTSAGAVLDGFTVTNGVAGQGPGGGVLLMAGQLKNSVVAGNTGGDGAGVYVGAGAIRDSLVTGNRGVFSGGGVFADRAESLVWGCTVTGNSARVGGGVFCQTGQVWWSEIRANVASNSAGGVWVTNGLVFGCKVVGNVTTNVAGGFLVSGTGSVYNSLSADNVAGQLGGGGYCGSNSAVRSCTIAGNTAREGGGLYAVNNVQVENTVIYTNLATVSVNWTNVGAGAVYQYCCTVPTNRLTGDGNIQVDPLLLNPAASDYRLGGGSPCMEVGSNQDWMATTADVGGGARIAGAQVDIGAYEVGALVCSVVPSKLGGSLPDLAQFVFRASVGGFDVGNLVYFWDFDGDAVADVSGADRAVVTNTYLQEGYWPVSVVVSNELTEEWSRSATVMVYVATYYVSPAGGHVYPYTNWTMAATSVQAAVGAAWAGSWVRVADGTYGQTNALLVNKALLVRSENGAAATVLRGAYPALTARVVQVTSAGAVLDGFTITNGVAGGVAAVAQGGGVYLQAGRLQNSIVAGNVGTNGAGVYLGAGVVSNCLVTGNRAAFSGGGIHADRAESLVWGCSVTGNFARLAGGVYCQTGQVWWTEIRANAATNAAGGVWVTNGLLFGCKMVGNWSTNGGGFFVSGTGAVYNSLSVDNIAVLAGGGGYCASNTLLRSCTVAGNTARDGGGIYVLNNAQFDNCVVYSNRGSVSLNWTNVGLGASWQYSCVAPAIGLGGTGNTDADPLFLSVPAGNYRLAGGSPCLDAGLDQGWMTGASDVVGGSRIRGAHVDMGAYEAGGLTVAISASKPGGSLPALNTFVFRAVLGGTNLANLVYYWDWDGDGAVDLIAPDQPVITNTYLQEGYWPVTVAVTNSISGESASAGMVIYIATYYASPFGGNIYPYTNWAMSATSIQAAVDAAWEGSWVRVGPGVYGVTAGVVVAKGLLVQSVAGASNTIIRGSYPTAGGRCLVMSNSLAIVDGFTLTNGWASGAGALGNGGGALVEAGILKNSMLLANVATNGGGAWVGPAGALYNCLVASNAAIFGGGIYATGGLVRSSTVAGNFAWRSGGGVFSTPVYAQNSIFYNNIGTGGLAGVNFTNIVAGYSYSNCCSLPIVTGDVALVNGNIEDDPLLLGSYRLGAGSPCASAGTNQSWMGTATDLAGNPRIMDGRVDIGAYEYVVGTLELSLSPDKTAGSPWGDLSNFVFRLTVGGSTVGLYTWWDFNSDGTNEYEGAGLRAATNGYTASGLYSVSVMASNSLGEVGTVRWDGYLSSAIYYVNVSNSTPQWPYTNWSFAANQLYLAVLAAQNGTVVMVTNGVYTNAGFAPFTIDKAIVLTSVDGPSKTDIRPGVIVTVPKATLQGFRLNGLSQAGRSLVDVRASSTTIRSNWMESAERYVLAWDLIAANLTFEGNVARNSFTRGLDLRKNSGIRVRNNLFVKHGLRSESASDFLAEGNVFVGFDMTLTNSQPIEFTNVLGTAVVRNNNIVYNSSVGMGRFGSGSDVIATNNWWGTPNGPRDELGSVEVAPGDPDPGVSVMLNVAPAGNLGPLVTDGFTNGSAHVDYFPWAGTTNATAYRVPPSAMWVDSRYSSGGTNDGHEWGYSAYSNLTDALSSVLYWYGMPVYHTIYVPQDFGTVQEGLAAPSLLTNVVTTVLVSTNTLGFYTNTWAGTTWNAWLITRPSLTLRADPNDGSVVLIGGLTIQRPYVTVDGFTILTGAVSRMLYPVGAANMTIKNCHIGPIPNWSVEAAGSTLNMTFEHNYIERSRGTYINPGCNYGRYVSNYYDGAGMNFDVCNGIRIEHNTFFQGGPSFNVYHPIQFGLTNKYTNFVVNNNFLAFAPGEQCMNVNFQSRYSSTPPYSDYTNVEDMLYIVAESNWWGSTNGPYDVLGTEEVSVSTPLPGPLMSNMVNALPDPSTEDIGAAINSFTHSNAYNYGRAGVNNCDYFPWSMGLITNGWSFVTPPRDVYVNTNYLSTGANGEYFPDNMTYLWGTNAFTNIQLAVDTVAANGGQVWLATQVFWIAQQVNVTKGIDIMGTPGQTVVAFDYPSSTGRCFYMNSPFARLNGLVITNGHALGSGDDGKGGGVYLATMQATPENPGARYIMANCTVIGCEALDVGGGVYASASGSPYGPLLNSCQIVNNTAGNDGGGVYSAGGLIPYLCSFSGNRAALGNGGGAYIAGGAPITLQFGAIATSAFDQNEAGLSGGGVWVSNPAVVSWAFTNNTSLAGSGGGMAALGGRVSSSLFMGNSATQGMGGGIWAVTSLVSSCTVMSNTALHGGGVASEGAWIIGDVGYGNTAVGEGGGLFAGTNVLVRNSLFARNLAGVAGGGMAVATTSGAATVQNCTIADNYAPAGSGIAIGSGTVVNTISYYNVPAETNWHFYGGPVSIDNCDAADDLTAFGMNNVQGRPAFINPSALNYRLSVWSACLDKGQNQAWMYGTTDLGGGPRLVPTNGVVDIGAYESPANRRTSLLLILQ